MLDIGGFNTEVNAITGAGTVTNSVGAATLELLGTSTFAGVIQDGAGVTSIDKQVSGTTTLSGTNTYTGSTTVTAGTLQLGGSGVIHDSSDLIVKGGVFDLNDNSETVASLSGTGGSIDLGTGTLTVTQAADLTYGGIISGTDGLTKTGANTLTLSGVNTYEGDTTVSAGTVQVSASERIDNDSNLVMNGGTLDLNTFTETVANLTGTGNIDTGGTTGLLVVNQSVAGTYSGGFSGTTTWENYYLRKSGAETLTLSGTNIQTGDGRVGIDQGTLQVQNGNAVGDNQLVELTAAGAEFELLSDEAVGHIAAAAGTNIRLNGNTLTLNGDLSGAKGTIVDSVISGNGAAALIINLDNDMLILSGTNTFTDTTTLNSGTLMLLSGTAIDNAAEIITTGGTLQVQVAETIGSLSGSGAMTLNASLSTGDAGSDTISGTISGGGGLIKMGSGTLALNGANTFSGGITVAEGTLSLGSDSAAGSGAITTTGSVIDYADGVTIANLANVNSDTTQLQVATGFATQSGDISEISRPRPIEKIGAGTLILSGANTYTGLTTISVGTLELSGGSAIADTGEIANDGTLVVNTAETIGALSGAGAVTLHATLTTGDAGDDTISGIISGSGGLTKQGSGTLILSGANTYSGTTAVSSGHLQIDQSIAGGAVVIAGAYLANNGTIAGDVINNGTVTSENAVFGGFTNASTFNASGSTIINGSFANAGTTSMANGATGETMTVNGNMSGGGQLDLDVDFATNTGDSLLVDGSTSGTTAVSLMSSTTDDPAIESELTLITVTGSASDSDFVLASGPLVVGAYSFDLALASGKWALSGQVNTVGEAYETAPIALGGLLNMPTLEQRRGQARNLAASVEGKRLVGGSWGRVFANNFNSELDGSSSGTAVEADIGGFQVGYDYVVPNGPNGVWVLGLTGQTGTVGSTTSNSSNDAKSYNFGATATWFGNDGWYADGQMQFSFLESSFSADGTDLAENEKGYGVGLSAEFGKRIALSSTSAIVPQAQISWTQLDGGDFTDFYGNSVSIDNIQSTRGRLGLAFEYLDYPNNTKLYAIGSIFRDFSNNNSVFVDGVPLGIGDLGTWAKIGVGVGFVAQMG